MAPKSSAGLQARNRPQAHRGKVDEDAEGPTWRSAGEFAHRQFLTRLDSTTPIYANALGRSSGNPSG